MSEREMASLIGVSHMTLNRSLRELADLNFVDYTNAGRAHLWQVNKKSLYYSQFTKLISCLDSLPVSIDELKTLIRKDLGVGSVLKIILFGSIAQKKATPASDIDLFVLTHDEVGKRALEKRMEELAIICLEKFGNRLSPYVLTKKEYTKKIDSTLIKNIEQGMEIFSAKEG